MDRSTDEMFMFSRVQREPDRMGFSENPNGGPLWAPRQNPKNKFFMQNPHEPSIQAQLIKTYNLSPV